jgi:hypothetical protein
MSGVTHLQQQRLQRVQRPCLVQRHAGTAAQRREGAVDARQALLAAAAAAAASLQV